MRKKNALRQHLLAPYDVEAPDTKPANEDFLKIGRYVTAVEDSGDIQAEDYADYAGDGTLSSDVTGITETWEFTGFWDPQQQAQQLVKSKKRAVGDERKLWHKIIETDGTEVVGVGTLSANIVAGSGEASEYEAFSFAITFDKRPEVTDGGSGE